MDRRKAGATTLPLPGLAAPTTPPRLAGAEGHLGRYEILELLDSGGMGEVWRVFDRVLGCRLAMKVIKASHADNALLVERFRAEARIAASLQHPGTVPVHDLGELSDGRPFYTMMEVSGGRTLAEAVQEVWTASEAGGPDKVPAALRRLVEALWRVSGTIAYAHEQSVLHLDLKPANIMLGRHGEILVLDWGMARALDDARQHRPFGGTVGYAAPEQLYSDAPPVACGADVHALGVILAEILTGRARPIYDRERARAAPQELVELSMRATSPDPARRPADAAHFAAELEIWLDGARRRDRALALVEEAGRARDALDQLREQLDARRKEAGRAEAHLPSWAGVERKRVVWALQDEVRRLERAAQAQQETVTQSLEAALREVDDCAEAHAALADLYQALHVQQEEAGDATQSARSLHLLRRHDRGRFAAYIQGTGALTLVTDPPDVHVLLNRLAEQDRRLQPMEALALGATPLHRLVLPMGTYIAELRAEGRATVRLPLEIGRQQHWDGVPPGARQPLAIPIPPADALGPEDVYVAPGPAWVGGDPIAMYAWERARVWVGGFIVRRHPVRTREYLRFLDETVQDEQDPETARLVPRARSGPEGLGVPFVRRGADGRFVPVPDAEGHVWDPDWPALFIDHACALAFAAWERARTGQPWRLPTELEWEKAARGVDGRLYPWGSSFDPTFTSGRDSTPPPRLPCRVDDYPTDESPYGVRGMAGNVRCWCQGVWSSDPDPTRAEAPRPGPDEPALIPVRGGAWSGFERGSRAARRVGHDPAARLADLGVRLARSWPSG